MKKTFLKILVVTVSALLAICTFTACGGYKSTTMKSWGDTTAYENTNGGFVRETENYVYVINGQGTNTASNKFGNPVKGSLIAVEKSKLGTAEMTAEIVVPKLFVGTDYNAGIYIFGDYVYYGTPSTDKKPDGSVANTSLAFMKTKLDGTATKEFFSVSGLNTEFRFVKSGDDVMLVYYDSAEKELAVYNTKTGDKTVIAKTDSKAEGESLATYKFVDKIEDGVAVVYSTTVYAEDYDETLAEVAGDNYSRKTEDYNRVYAYKVGDEEAKLILDGKATTDGGLETKYTLSFVKEGYVFFKKIDTENIGAEKTFMVKATSLYNASINLSNVVENTADATESVLIVSAEEVYKVVDTKIVKTTLKGSALLVEQTVAEVSSVSKLLAKNGDYVYFTNSANVLMRVNVATGEKEMEEKVSNDVIHANWYAPEILTIGEKEYMFFCDTSSTGASYVNAIDLGSAVLEEKNDDDEVVSKYLDASFPVAVMTDKDVAIIAETLIKELDDELTEKGQVVLEEVDGKLGMSAVTKARAIYENLTPAQKKLVSDETVNYIKKYEKAVEVSVKLHALKDFDKLTDTEKDALRNAFDDATKAINEIEKDGNTEISVLLVENYRWFYQEADEYFNPSEDK